MEYRTSRDGNVLKIVDELNKAVIYSCAVTNVGMVRGNNEDNVQIWTFGKTTLGMVADGMGGAAGGEEASRLTVEAVQQGFIDNLPADPQNWLSIPEKEVAQMLSHTLMLANQAIIDRAAADHQLHGMGTTATLVLLNGMRAIFAHIGDSRAYLFDSESQHINQVSNDHSFVEALVESGHLTRDQAEIHPMRNVLYRALGQKPDNEVEIDIYMRDLNIGDRLVLCSDGLPRHLKSFEIGDIVRAGTQADEIAQQLIDLANERGGEDNVSAVVLMVEPLTP